MLDYTRIDEKANVPLGLMRLRLVGSQSESQTSAPCSYQISTLTLGPKLQSKLETDIPRR